MLIKTKNTNFKFHLPIYMVLSVFLVFFILLTNSVNVKAETTHSYSLPYNYHEFVDDFSYFESVSPDFYAKILGKTLSIVQQQSNWNLDMDSVILVPTGYNSSSWRYYFLVLSNCTISDTSSISSIYSDQVVLTSNASNYCYQVSFVAHDGYDFDDYFMININYPSGTTFRLFGSYQVNDNFLNTGLSIRDNYPMYVSNSLYDTADNLVFDTFSEWLPEDAILDEFHDSLDITSTISNGIDTSLSDIQNQKGFFDNLINNLKNFFNSLNGWINNGFSFLSGAIKSFFGPFLRNIQNYLNNFKESFEDFKDKWNHFFEIIGSIYNLAIENGEFSLAKLISVLLIPSQEDISSAFSGTVFYTLYTGVNNCVKYLYTYVTTLFSSTPNTFVMTLPTFTFGGKEFRGLQISFDWFIPYKTYFDIIVSGFLIMGYIRFLSIWINNFLHGSGFVDHDVNNISARSDSL